METTNQIEEVRNLIEDEMTEDDLASIREQIEAHLQDMNQEEFYDAMEEKEANNEDGMIDVTRMEEQGYSSASSDQVGVNPDLSGPLSYELTRIPVGFDDSDESWNPNWPTEDVNGDADETNDDDGPTETDAVEEMSEFCLDREWSDEASSRSLIWRRSAPTPTTLTATRTRRKRFGRVWHRWEFLLPIRDIGTARSPRTA